MIKKTNIKGVTLVELLVVVIILGAMTAIAVPRVSQSAANAKVRACIVNIDLLNSAIEQYNLDNGSYPGSLLDVSRNTNYFPDGELICPVTGTAYPSTLVNNRIDTVTHSHSVSTGDDGGEEDEEDEGGDWWDLFDLFGWFH